MSLFNYFVSDQNETSLEVVNVTKEDVTQEYTCQIFSPIGEDTSSAHLIAQGLWQIIYIAYISQVFLPMMHCFLFSTRFTSPPLTPPVSF